MAIKEPLFALAIASVLHAKSYYFGDFDVQLTELSCYLHALLQKAYLNYRVRRIKLKKKAGIDPISAAFERMKVYHWHWKASLIYNIKNL